MGSCIAVKAPDGRIVYIGGDAPVTSDLLGRVQAADWSEKLHPRDREGKFSRKGGGMLGTPVGRVQGGKWKFTGPVKAGDVLEDGYGDQGIVAGVSDDGVWVAAQWEHTQEGGKNRREIINTQRGEADAIWYAHQETAGEGQDWIRVVNGGVPLLKPGTAPRSEPGPSTEKWHRLGFVTPEPSPPGSEVAPGVKQLRLPGMPERGTGTPGSVAETERALDAAMVSDNEHDSKPGDWATVENPEGIEWFGNTADTNVVEFADGSTWVRKRGLSQYEMNTEMLVSRVSDVLGTGAPEVILRPAAKLVEDRTGFPAREEEWQPYVPGSVTAVEWLGGTDSEEEPLGDHSPDEMYQTLAGTKIGILDTITGMGDRHYGNWLVQTRDGEDVPVPIDNGGASFAGAGDTGFTEYLGWLYTQDIQPGEWIKWRRGLSTLHPQFTALERENDWLSMMHEFDRLNADYLKHAGGGG